MGAFEGGGVRDCVRLLRGAWFCGERVVMGRELDGWRVDGLVGGVRGQEVGGAETAWRTCLDGKGSGSGALANPKRSREACPPTADRWSLDVHDARVYITTLHLHLES